MSLLKQFPSVFVWGSATSAYQIEGAVDIDGREPSIWDVFCEVPGNTVNGDSGRKACDHYHRMQEDVRLIADMGLKAYRFSISWSRLFKDPITKTLNPKGVLFYNQLIDLLLQNDIQPWVTLYHWDLPQKIQDQHNGWLGEETIELFNHYASACFTLFGDRVKHWITINESWVVSVLGYGQGVFAPGRVSNVEPYQVAHNLLLAHAAAVDTYRVQFQKEQKGMIGISNNCDWREPLTESTQDQAAAQRALEFFLGWFADPIYLGDYPNSMKHSVGDRLPQFTEEQKRKIKGSSDFFGLNHYTTMYASAANGQLETQDVYGNGGLTEDQDVNLSVDEAWPITDFKWAVVPWGCRKLLHWIDQRYGKPDIYITENGCAYNDVVSNGVVDDKKRIEFYASYLEQCSKAIDEGVRLKGFFAWSLLDNFEWASGYGVRFGLHYVDFQTQQRIPKNSALWFKKCFSEIAD